MDPFVLILLAGFGALALWLVVLARFGGSGLDQVGWKSSREVAEKREALEAQDADQMLAAFNARRERRGERAVTLEELELRTEEARRPVRPNPDGGARTSDPA